VNDPEVVNGNLSFGITTDEKGAFWSFVIDQGQGLKASFPWYSIINLYGGADSQVNIPLSNPSAYLDRDALWVFQVSPHSYMFV
jgi:hypothetical protein